MQIDVQIIWSKILYRKNSANFYAVTKVSDTRCTLFTMPKINFIAKFYSLFTITKLKRFSDFGFTDMSIYLASKEEKYNIITGDRALCGICKENNALSIHFDEIKKLFWMTRR